MDVSFERTGESSESSSDDPTFDPDVSLTRKDKAVIELRNGLVWF